MERRQYQAEVRTDGRKITGLASPVYDKAVPGSEYELWEGVFERFQQGAFDEYLKTKPDVVALFNHDPNQILGRTPNTLSLRTDAKGLHYEIDPPSTTYAKDLQVSIERGDVRGSSFAFQADIDGVRWESEGNKEIRWITKAKLFDVSPVTNPAYGSSNTSLRSEERKQIEQERIDYKSKLRTEKIIARIDDLYKSKDWKLEWKLKSDWKLKS